MPVIPALRTLREEDYEFDASLGYIVRLSPNKKPAKNPEQIKKEREVT
jgi:hypothetical protein